jgi:NADH-quinone oxidoreductase subunit J
MDYLTFLILALPMIATAVAVILHPNPVYSALALVLTLFLLAVYFLFLDAHLVAVLQILVYAGAIMVLFLFVIMLLNLQEESFATGRRGLRQIAWLAGGVLILELFLLIRRSSIAPPTGLGTGAAGGEKLPEGFGTVRVLGERLFTDFLLPFEIASILLLIAIVGAVVMAKRRI